MHFIIMAILANFMSEHAMSKHIEALSANELAKAIFLSPCRYIPE